MGPRCWSRTAATPFPSKIPLRRWLRFRTSTGFLPNWAIDRIGKAAFRSSARIGGHRFYLPATAEYPERYADFTFLSAVSTRRIQELYASDKQGILPLTEPGWYSPHRQIGPPLRAGGSENDCGPRPWHRVLTDLGGAGGKLNPKLTEWRTLDFAGFRRGAAKALWGRGRNPASRSLLEDETASARAGRRQRTPDGARDTRRRGRGEGAQRTRTPLPYAGFPSTCLLTRTAPFAGRMRTPCASAHTCVNSAPSSRIIEE